MSFDYDGFYFVPNEDQTDLNLQMFSYNVEELKEDKSENTYHIAFFYFDENRFVFDEKFEAIFYSPMTYIKNLIGSKYHGIMARKSKRSGEWFDQLIKETMEKMNGDEAI